MNNAEYILHRISRNYVALLAILTLVSGCTTDETGSKGEWDQVLTVKVQDEPYVTDGEVFKIGVRYEGNRITTSEGHVLNTEPISTEPGELQSLAGKWFNDRGYFVSTYGPEPGDNQIGGWIYTGTPLNPENYTVIDPRPGIEGYRYFSTALYMGTLQEFDTNDDAKIDVWSVTLRENPLTRKGQLEYVSKNGRITRIGIEYPGTRIEAPQDRLREYGIDPDRFKSPWTKSTAPTTFGLKPPV